MKERKQTFKNLILNFVLTQDCQFGAFAKVSWVIVVHTDTRLQIKLLNLSAPNTTECNYALFSR